MNDDPNIFLTQAAIDLTSIAAKNTVSTIYDKIREVSTNKNLKEQNNELKEIINNLIDDKNALINIAKTYQEAVALQSISDDEIQYITDNLVPIIGQFVPQNQANTMEQLKKVFSKETLTILQLVGFNYKKAIGEPLTLYVRNAIESKITKSSETEKQNG